MKLARKVGATSEIWQIFIRDSSSTTGAGLTGLVFNSAGLTAYYHKDLDTTATAITLVTMTVGTFTSSGFKEIDATNMPGWYQFCPPNAGLSSGDSCGFHLKGATNMAPLPIEVDLDVQVDVTHWNGTAVTTPDTAGSPKVTITTGNGAGQLDFTSGIVKSNASQLLGTTIPTPTVAGVPNVNAKTWNDLTTVALPLTSTVAGRPLDVSTGGEAGLDWANVGSPTTSVALTGTTIAATQKVDVETIKTNPVVNGGTITFPTTATLASTTNITAGTIATVTNVTTVNGLAANTITAASIASDAITDAKVASDVTIASVTGAVGSVTGAVGSVTGNVGGNVLGTVATVNALAANVITAASIADGAIDRATFAADTGLQSIRSNTAQAGAAGNLTLDASASAVTNFYVNDLLTLTGGTGVGQSRYITAYDGTTKVATVNSNWKTTPDVTTTFSVIGADAIVGATAPTAAQVATAVWTDTTAGDFTAALSVGKSVMNGVTLGTGLTVARATLVDTLTTYTGNTVQTGDTFNLANGANGFVATKADTAAILVDTGTTLDGRIPAALVGGRMDSSVGAMAANTLTASALATDAVTEIQTGLATPTNITAATGITVSTNNDKTGYGLSSAAVQAVWDEPTASAVTAASMGKLITDNVNATISSRSTLGGTAQTGDNYARLGAPAGASIAADLAGIRTGLSTKITKNVALSNFPFLMVDSTDHVSAKTGLAITATRSIDGAAFSACTNSAVEISNGMYQINLSAADLNGNTITLLFTGTGADARRITIITQPAAT